jgi:membrane protease YdiL (CAAX protease family)
VDKIARIGPKQEILIAIAVTYAIVFGTAILGVARWLTYAAFLYVPVGMCWLRGTDFAEYGLILTRRSLTIRTALVSALLILGAFSTGYWLVVHKTDLPVPWSPGFEGTALQILRFAIIQVAVVAIAEEYFYRGYVQAKLDEAWTPRWMIFGARLGPGWLLATALFAAGHLAETANPARLLTFFPGLWFGWARSRTGNVYAGVFVHAASNLLIAYLQGQSIS